MIKIQGSEPLEVRRSIERYERQPDPIEHERLRPIVDQYYGANVAEFFDEEGCLPLSSSGGVGDYPWPMRTAGAASYAAGVFVLSVVAAMTFLGLLGRVMPNPFTAVAVSVCVGVAVWLGIPAVHRLFPPADVSERKRLVGVFNDIVARNMGAAAVQSESARAARLRTRDSVSTHAKEPHEAKNSESGKARKETR